MCAVFVRCSCDPLLFVCVLLFRQSLVLVRGEYMYGVRAWLALCCSLAVLPPPLFYIFMESTVRSINGEEILWTSRKWRAMFESRSKVPGTIDISTAVCRIRILHFTAVPSCLPERS